MKQLVLWSLVLTLGVLHGAPVETDGMEEVSCDDAAAKGAAGLAVTKINQDKKDWYIWSLKRLSDAHMVKHGENGVVYYLTLDVVETNCSVLSRKDWKDCQVRSDADLPFYGQCKATIYISRVNRVVRLYKYDCSIRPVPNERLNAICPDCPTNVDLDNAEVLKAVQQSLEKFNKESTLPNHFNLLKVQRAISGMMAVSMFYSVEYTIQETTCAKSTDAATKCPLMDCEFAHKGFCKGQMNSPAEPDAAVEILVDCEIFEPEAANREKALHLADTDHAHNDTKTHVHDHDAAHAADAAHSHDHVHDHTKSHVDHDKTHQHADNAEHHHTHDHADGSSHKHAHAHSHDHGHGHDHVHTHHAKAHDHAVGGLKHHDYNHGDEVHTHEHDHELALDHDHKHIHLHDHEHHHHHHDHTHETGAHDHPEGKYTVLPYLGAPVTLPAFPDADAAAPEIGVVLPAVPDPQIPGEMEPIIRPFPKTHSAQCVAPLIVPNMSLLDTLFLEDPLFKHAA